MQISSLRPGRAALKMKITVWSWGGFCAGSDGALTDLESEERSRTIGLTLKVERQVSGSWRKCQCRARVQAEARVSPQ